MTMRSSCILPGQVNERMAKVKPAHTHTNISPFLGAVLVQVFAVVGVAVCVCVCAFGIEEVLTRTGPC